MNARALVVGTGLALGFAGCGLTAVGSHEDAPPPEVPPDATGASLIETSAVDTTPPPTPGSGSTQTPIGALDAGSDADAQLDASSDAPPTVVPFAIVASPGGAFHSITPPGAITPCSAGGFVPATMIIQNLSSEKVTVGWVDYACTEITYGTLGSNLQYAQPTFVGNRWRIRNDADSGIRADFVIDAAGTYIVTVR